MKFSDDVEIKTDGPLRIMKRKDGWYVVGDGMMIPCDDRNDAEETLTDLQEAK